MPTLARTTDTMIFRSTLLLPLLLIALPAITACEGKRVSMTSASTHVPAFESQISSASEHLREAQSALSEQDYMRCAARFAAAAKVSSEAEASSCWYRASQCAARGGDYRQSRFHLQTAASAGFANLRRMREDPLLRPLKSNSRYQLIDDLVSKNQVASSRAHEQEQQEDCEGGGGPARLAQLDSQN